MQRNPRNAASHGSHLIGYLLRNTTTLLLAICILCLPTGTIKSEEKQLKRSAPNIVLILADDAGEDSYNILPALLGEKLDEPIRDAVIHHSGAGLFGVRRGKWKLLLGLGPGGFSGGIRQPKPGQPRGQLYDLENDPCEKNNLYMQHPEIVAELSGLLDEYKKLGRSAPIR